MSIVTDAAAAVADIERIAELQDEVADLRLRIDYLAIGWATARVRDPHGSDSGQYVGHVVAGLKEQAERFSRGRAAS